MDLTKLIKDAGAEGKPHCATAQLTKTTTKNKWTPNPNVPQHATHLGFMLATRFKGFGGWMVWVDNGAKLDVETSFVKICTMLDEARLDFPGQEWKIISILEVSR